MGIINQRFLLRYAVFFIVVASLMFNSISHAGSITHEDLEKAAGKQAESFLARISEKHLDEIESVSLSYEVHMTSGFQVRMTMNATIKMDKSGKGYISTFRLTEPEGKDVWSWLLLNLFGKHTKDYRELVQSIETVFIERLHMEKHRFVTDDLEEFLPAKKYYPNQTAI